MPPKKKNPPNAFMNFALEWKSQYGQHMSMAEATAEAGNIWKTMSTEERAPYKERAKEEKMQRSSKPAEKLTCTGVPLSFVEKEKLEIENKERQTKRDIENTVSQSVKNDELDTKSYYFIMVNYFTKTLKSAVYVPAELSVCEYCLKDGIKRTYHTLINPGVNIYGHHYEAQHHSENTHNLPLPPNALGAKNLGCIYNDVLNFIREEDTGAYPPVYTHHDCLHVVESVLDFLRSDVTANNIDLKIYPIQYLFFIMKGSTCEVGELEKPRNFYITDAFFERDPFEYQIGIACQYHEEIDRSKYCTQSYVTRWGYMFSDYMCGDIAIPMKPGRHCPRNTQLQALANPARTPAPESAASTTGGDNTSFISMATTSSYATKAVAGSKIYYDDQKSALSDGGSKNYNSSFPALGFKKKSNKPITPSHQRPANCSVSDMAPDEHSSNLNPWTSRSRNVPREPDNTDFSIEFSKDESDLEDFNSMASFGRGRALLNTSFNLSTASRGSGGRGRTMRR